MSLDKLIPVEDALRIVLGNAKPNPSVELELKDAVYCVLAQDLSAKRTQPPFDASSMDGYAVRGKDLTSLPVELKVTDEAKAGTPSSKPLGQGEAIRIFTGGVVPQGADTIIIQENTQAEGDVVRILKSNNAGRFIRKAGMDFNEGDVLLASGEILKAFKLSLAASMNHANVPVHRPPHVGLIATGDELVLPGNATSHGQIIASNTFGINASAVKSGAKVSDFGIALDTRENLKNKLQNALSSGVDIIVTTGGASVGDHDLVLPVAQELGFQFKIKKIAMRPGKPFLFAELKQEDRTVFLTGLAGNPVSSLVAFHIFVKPLIMRLSGRTDMTSQLQDAILGCDLPQNDERMEYMRATLETRNDGVKIATPFSAQDSSMLKKLVQADCLVLRTSHAPTAQKEEACQILILD